MSSPEEPGGPIPAPDASGRNEAPGPATVSPSIFRAYDIRGVVGETLSREVVYEIGRAIGSEAAERGQPTIVTGRDGRVSSPELGEALAAGLQAAGRNVIDVGPVPTPVLYFATCHFDTRSGVMVTGSHNPPEYNGLKIVLGGETLFGRHIAALRTRILGGSVHTGSGGYERRDVVEDYVRRIREDLPPAWEHAFKVVLDCGNGIAGAVAPALIRALGHEVIELYCEVDGRFPNHHPDPSQPENLGALIDAVREHEADLGFAYDGDGDRLGVVDAAGNVIWPDRQLMLLAADVLSRHPGAEIVFDVKCSRRLGEFIRARGGIPVMWKTGHSFIKKKLRESNAPLAGEMSGHIFFGERWYGFDDAIYASVRLLEVLMRLGSPPCEVFAGLPGGFSTPEIRVDMAEDRHHVFMENMARGDRFASGEVTRIDGVRVDYADAWGLVRASNTTPSLVLRFEGDTPEALRRVQAEFRDALLALDPDLRLPFPRGEGESCPSPGAPPRHAAPDAS